MIRNEILSSIDNIDIVRSNSEVCVIESMINIFDKSFMIMENYENDDLSSFSIFQEGELLDKVKKQGEKDSNKLITIIKFIPRLIMAFIESLKQPKDSKDKLNKFKRNSKKLDKLSLEEKRKKVKELNKQWDDGTECYLDEKTGKIKFKNGKGRLLAKLATGAAFVMSTFKLYEGIKKEFDILDPSKIRKFVDDCDKVLHGDKSVSIADLYEGGLGAISDLMGHFFRLSGEIAIIGTAICRDCDDAIKKDKIKDVPNEKKQELMKNINDLSARITKINAQVAITAGLISRLLDWGEMLGIGVRKFDTDMKSRDRATEEIHNEVPKMDDETSMDYYNRTEPLIQERIRENAQKEAEEYQAKVEEARQKHKEEKAARRNKSGQT